MYKQLFAAALFAAFVFAGTPASAADDDEQSGQKKKITVIVNDESAQVAVSDSTDAAQEVRDAAAKAEEEIAEAAQEAKDQAQVAVEEAKDAADDAKEEAREAAEQAREDAQEALEEKGHSGGGILGLQTVWLNTKPFKDLVAKESSLRGKDFDFGSRPMVMLGMGGMHEHPSGYRGGVTIWGGYRSYQSDEFGKVAGDSTTHDSVTVLRVIPAYFGYTMDKAFHFSRFSVNLGGMLGGGAYIVQKKDYDLDESETFVSTNGDGSNDTQNDYGAWSAAPFFAWEVRAGMGVELAPVFHVGIEGFALFTYAPEGFGVATGDFVTVNPGVRLKLIFGKAG
jgi:vacuolar-type H+-ATPase subunit H